jgi:hypothetical protein
MGAGPGQWPGLSFAIQVIMIVIARDRRILAGGPDRFSKVPEL